jgi:hypothetical protein
MEFVPIVPTNVLQTYLGKRKTWFALAQEMYAGKPTKYLDFYRSAPDDKVVILDNGTYEGKLDIPQYAWVIAACEPEVVVLPDIYLGDYERSLYLSLGFLEQCGLSSQTYHNEWMFVPQAKPGDVEGFCKAAALALNDKRITWIGIPRCLCTDIADDPLARVNFANSLRKNHPHIKVHALGMVNGNVHELYYLQKAGVLSCDSSAPYNHGDPESNLEAIDQCLNTP